MQIRIEVQPVKCEDLQPGDLFSARDQEYWDRFPHHKALGHPVGESVGIRTTAPVEPEDLGTEVYKITIHREEDRLSHESYHVDMDYDEEGNRIGVLTANPDCPYCRGEYTEDDLDWQSRLRQTDTQYDAIEEQGYDAKDAALQQQAKEDQGRVT